MVGVIGVRKDIDYPPNVIWDEQVCQLRSGWMCRSVLPDVSPSIVIPIALRTHEWAPGHIRAW